MLGILTQERKTITAGQVGEAVVATCINVEISEHIDRILKGVSDDETDTTTLETVGFIRGVLEAYLVSRYMKILILHRNCLI